MFPRFFFLSNDNLLEVCSQLPFSVTVPIAKMCCCWSTLPPLLGRDPSSCPPTPTPLLHGMLVLQILAETKDPRAVQPYLSKSFEGLKTIEFIDPPTDYVFEPPVGPREAETIEDRGAWWALQHSQRVHC